MINLIQDNFFNFLKRNGCYTVIILFVDTAPYTKVLFSIAHGSGILIKLVGI